MKTITSAEAQQIANMTGCFLAVDSDGRTFLYNRMPSQERDNWNSYANNPCFELPIRIADDRPWHEQIWEPETYNKETDKWAR